MIIKQISKYDFIDAFKAIRPDNFTYEGLQALYDYLDNLSDDINENIELDVIAICCDYSQYETAWEAMEQYQPEDMPTVDNSEGMDLLEITEASEQLALDWLNDRTLIITFDGGVIIQNF